MRQTCAPDDVSTWNGILMMVKRKTGLRRGVRGSRRGGRGFAGVSSRTMIYAHVNTWIRTRLTVTYEAELSAYCLIVYLKAKVYYTRRFINNKCLDSFVLSALCQASLTH